MADAVLELDLKDLNAQISALLAPQKTRPLLDSIGRTLRTDVQFNFKRQAGPDGQPWKPTHRGGQILRDSGRLLRSIDYRVESDSEVRIGTNVVYARIHNFGGTISGKNGNLLRFKIGDRWVSKQSVEIPARPFIGISNRQIDLINKAIDRWLERLGE